MASGAQERDQGGEAPCLLELVCEECGRLNDEPGLVACGGCGSPLGRE